MLQRHARGLTLVLTFAVANMFGAPARAEDDYVKAAKAFVAKVTASSAPWTGPTTGPRAQSGKSVVYVSADQNNGGARGVGEGAEEAAKAIGWNFKLINGQGTVSGRATALTQAISLKPDGIILGTVDAVEQAPLIEQAAQLGIVVVGWHSGAGPGKIEGSPVFTNVTSDPLEVAKAAALFAVADSDGKAGVIIFTDSIYAAAIAKTDAAAAAIKDCKGCSVLDVEDTPLGDVSNRMPSLTSSLLSKYGSKWTYSIGCNDLYFDFSAPALQAAGLTGDGKPVNISVGDGSQSAFQRVREKQYQGATAAEPVHVQGYQVIDEMIRALAKQPPSGYVTPAHLVISSNVDADGGTGQLYDPANGYKDAYKKIWLGE